MPARATAHPSPVSHAPRLRIGVAALAASLAIALGTVLVTDGGDRAGSSSQSGSSAASVSERPDIDARQAAEKFHHRR
jgi:hypothetical protein